MDIQNILIVSECALQSYTHWAKYSPLSWFIKILITLQTLTCQFWYIPFQHHLLFSLALKFFKQVAYVCHLHCSFLKAWLQASETDGRSIGTSSQPDPVTLHELHLPWSLCSTWHKASVPSSLGFLVPVLSWPLPKWSFLVSFLCTTMVLCPRSKLLFLYTHFLGRYSDSCVNNHLHILTSKSRTLVRIFTHAPVTRTSLPTPTYFYRTYPNVHCRLCSCLLCRNSLQTNFSRLWTHTALPPLSFIQQHHVLSQASSSVIWTSTFYYLNFALTFVFSFFSAQLVTFPWHLYFSFAKSYF